jgi:hypothetical protein
MRPQLLQVRARLDAAVVPVRLEVLMGAGDHLHARHRLSRARFAPPGLSLERDPRDLLTPFPAELLMMWPIGARVNNPTTTLRAFLDPFEPVDADSRTLL